MTATDVCDLVLEACHLAERAHRLAAPVLAAEAQHMRAALCDALSACDDEAVAADARDAVCRLDALLAEVDRGFALSA
jgi:hypothetical protein